MPRPPFKIRQLGEIAIRCSDMDAMFGFYRDIVGLDVLSDNRDAGIAFFRICAGFGGHTRFWPCFTTMPVARICIRAGRMRLKPVQNHHCITWR